MTSWGTPRIWCLYRKSQDQRNEDLALAPRTAGHDCTQIPGAAGTHAADHHCPVVCLPLRPRIDSDSSVPVHTCKTGSFDHVLSCPALAPYLKSNHELL